MGKNRLETCSDGVIAIIITIMVLELKVPHDPDFRALIPLWPVFMSYVLSFVYIGSYWNKLQYANNPSTVLGHLSLLEGSSTLEVKRSASPQPYLCKRQCPTKNSQPTRQTNKFRA
jgi:hypothetical protein